LALVSAELKLTAAQARRIALGAQGFAPGRPQRPPGLQQITRAVRDLGLLQLDSVNVFCRAHYMPLFSRLGPYDRDLLDRITAHGDSGAERRLHGARGRADRRMIEYWAHEASLIPIEHHRLLRWRMETGDQAWGSIQRISRERPNLVADTLQLVAEQGPVRARDTGIPRKQAQAGQMWNWHDGKIALEYLFYSGQISAASRINFERRYDLTERILPEHLRGQPVPARDEAQRELLRISAAALGVATEPDLGDYFRLPRADSKQRVAELVRAGELIEVEVAGWDAPAYLWPAARRPRTVQARALLSPFDPLVFFRPRAERIFGFRYRIEIYVPAPKRQYGYYVLPFLMGDRLVARVDLKSDRQAGVLRVQGAFQEDGEDRAAVAAGLAAELVTVAAWMGLEHGVEVAPNGDLAAALTQAL
jgi:uncharacterized protein